MLSVHLKRELGITKCSEDEKLIIGDHYIHSVDRSSLHEVFKRNTWSCLQVLITEWYSFCRSVKFAWGMKEKHMKLPSSIGYRMVFILSIGQVCMRYERETHEAAFKYWLPNGIHSVDRSSLHEVWKRNTWSCLQVLITEWYSFCRSVKFAWGMKEKHMKLPSSIDYRMVFILSIGRVCMRYERETHEAAFKYWLPNGIHSVDRSSLHAVFKRNTWSCLQVLITEWYSFCRSVKFAWGMKEKHTKLPSSIGYRSSWKNHKPVVGFVMRMLIYSVEKCTVTAAMNSFTHVTE